MCARMDALILKRYVLQQQAGSHRGLMGNILELPRDQRDLYHRNGTGRGHYTGYSGQQGQTMPERQETSLQSRTPVILPFNSFEIRPDKVEEIGNDVTQISHDRSFPTSTPRQHVLMDEGHQNAQGRGHSPMSFSHNGSRLEVETTKINSTPSSVAGSAATAANKRKHNYIKRYRNEEEKMMDLLNEKDTILKSAIRQGQQLRAKCNRYRDELDNLKMLSQTDVTENQWKKKYFEMDKKYRDAKEQLDVFVARNKNGRDFLEQQKDTIDVLNLELQRERLQKQQMMSNSLSSLHSIGMKDKKGKVTITQLAVDNQLLQERLANLESRNQRGREYLAKIEAENREYNAMITKLKSQLLQEKAEKEGAAIRVNGTGNTEEPDISQMYAKVDKSIGKHTDMNSEYRSDSSFNQSPEENNSTHETKSYGFELDDEYGSERENTNRLTSVGYEEIEFSSAFARIPREEEEEEEFVIEAELEPEEENQSNTDVKQDTDHRDTTNDKVGDEIDAGYSSPVSTYEPVRLFDGEVITKF